MKRRSLDTMRQFGATALYLRREDAAQAEEHVARLIPKNADVVLLVNFPPQPKHPDPFCHVGTVAAKWYI